MLPARAAPAPPSPVLFGLCPNCPLLPATYAYKPWMTHTWLACDALVPSATAPPLTPRAQPLNHAPPPSRRPRAPPPVTPGTVPGRP
ncbi:hypothetical protein PtA15_10A589 [Puccinia triticina]|uniref:Secreted protein n=1 Tax=Puccinia triticina TaxID=208348 RepID=A0ABY7CZF3_9BASI|nr:uncharacterized protein PtA15_10A589 [Puccinia triticina]WAQ89165.1 hypothetical protein PtA15_10A589 [Puccinia triticina]